MLGDVNTVGCCQTIFPDNTAWPYNPSSFTYTVPDQSARIAALEDKVAKLSGQIETLTALLAAKLER